MSLIPVPPRKRLVNFKVDEDELQQLKADATRAGFRGVSGYARARMLQEEGFVSQLQKMEKELAEIKLLVKHLISRTDSPSHGLIGFDTWPAIGVVEPSKLIIPDPTTNS